MAAKRLDEGKRLLKSSLLNFDRNYSPLEKLQPASGKLHPDHNVNVAMSTNNYIELTSCVRGAGPGARHNGCSICGQGITSSESSTTRITCSNTWHTPRILQWSEVLEKRRENTTCPICRQCLLPKGISATFIKAFQAGLVWLRPWRPMAVWNGTLSLGTY